MIPFVIGIGLIVVSLKIQSKYRELLNSGERTEGVVFDLEKDIKTDFNHQYPIIRFVTKKGEWITRPTDLGISLSTYKQGDKLNVIYNSNKPEEFMIESKWQTIISKGLIFLGIVALLIGVFLLY